MNGQFPPAPAEVLYPDTDPDDMPENPPHLLALVALVATLRYYFRPQPDVYVIGDVFWYWQEGNPKACKAPDLMVIRGVDPRTQRRSFKSWEHGDARPCFILEIVSERTVDEDRDEKRALYERLGVREYFLFDPEGEFLDRPLIGYRLMNERYEELVPHGDGSIPSNQLALTVVPEEGKLAFISMRTGQALREPAEMLEEILAELFEARKHTEEVEREAEQERQRAELASARVRQLAEQEGQRALEAERLVVQERQRAEQEKERAEQEKERAELAERDAAQQREVAELERRRAEALVAEVARLRAALPPNAP